MQKNGKQPTGVIGLDAVIDGGYPSGSVVIINGSPLSGIDHIARQFWKVEGDGGIYLMIDSDVEEGMVDARTLTPDAFPVYYQGRRIIIDSLSSLILNFGIDDALRCLLLARKQAIRDESTIMFLLYNNIHKPEDENRIFRIFNNATHHRNFPSTITNQQSRRQNSGYHKKNKDKNRSCSRNTSKSTHFSKNGFL